MNFLACLPCCPSMSEEGGECPIGAQLQRQWIVEMSHLLNSCRFAIEIFTSQAGVQVFF